MVKRSAPRTAWKRGQSGNPNGRPKVAVEVRDLARQHTVEALRALAQTLKDKKAPHAAKVAAANSILDRGYGKPTQHIEANVNLLDKLNDAEQRSLEAALAALAGEPGDAVDGTASTHH